MAPHNHSQVKGAPIGGGEAIASLRRSNNRDVSMASGGSISQRQHRDHKWDASSGEWDASNNKWDAARISGGNTSQHGKWDASGNTWDASVHNSGSASQQQHSNRKWDAANTGEDASSDDSNAAEPQQHRRDDWDASAACGSSTPQQRHHVHGADKAAVATPRRRGVVYHRTGDLLEATDDYIVHQTNCMTRSAGGLAKAIFDKWPHANTYSGKHRRTLGRMSVHGDGKRLRRVVNIYGQHRPGAPTNHGKDTRANRLQCFQRALRQLAHYIMATRTGHATVAFPARIGCGLARGDWTKYQRALLQFTNMVNAKEGLTVRTTVYRLPQS